MSGNKLLEVYAAENGYILEVCGREKDEPAQSSEGPFTVGEDDSEQYVAPTLEAVLKMITEKLPNLVPKTADQDFVSTFLREAKNDD